MNHAEIRKAAEEAKTFEEMRYVLLTLLDAFEEHTHVVKTTVYHDQGNIVDETGFTGPPTT